MHISFLRSKCFWSNIMGVRKHNTQNIMKDTTAKSVVNFAKFSMRTEFITTVFFFML